MPNKIIIWLLTSETGKEIVKKVAISMICVCCFIVIIPVAFIESINPYLTSEADKNKREDDVYDKVLQDIKEKRQDKDLIINLDMVRIFEYFVVFDSKKELNTVDIITATKHLEQYYLYEEEVEETVEKKDDKIGEIHKEIKKVAKTKGKTLDEIIADLRRIEVKLKK